MQESIKTQDVNVIPFCLRSCMNRGDHVDTRNGEPGEFENASANSNYNYPIYPDQAGYYIGRYVDSNLLPLESSQFWASPAASMFIMALSLCTFLLFLAVLLSWMVPGIGSRFYDDFAKKEKSILSTLLAITGTCTGTREAKSENKISKREDQVYYLA